MLKPRLTGAFKKETKLMQKRGLDVNKLHDVMEMIVHERPLPPERKNHSLHGEWTGTLECHIQGDWVLIYEIDREACTPTFHHTGSHSDMF
jgi:mRNA interferase YafQ